MGKTLEQILNEMPATQQSVESIKEIIASIKEDQETSTTERAAILQKNITVCILRVKEIEKMLIQRT